MPRPIKHPSAPRNPDETEEERLARLRRGTRHLDVERRLVDADAKKIRDLNAHGDGWTIRALADRFDVNENVIQLILEGKTYTGAGGAGTPKRGPIDPAEEAAKAQAARNRAAVKEAADKRKAERAAKRAAKTKP